MSVWEFTAVYRSEFPHRHTEDLSWDHHRIGGCLEGERLSITLLTPDPNGCVLLHPTGAWSFAARPPG